MKKWLIFGYKPWAKGQRPKQYKELYVRYKPLVAGFWYLHSTRCPVTGAWV